LLFSTYLGGTNDDSSTGLTIDTGAANVYLTGTTNSTDFVVPSGSGAFQLCLNDPGVSPCPTPLDTTHTDAYVARFNNPTESTGGSGGTGGTGGSGGTGGTGGSGTTTSTQVALGYFSYLGGAGNDSGLAIAVDTGQGALVTGATSSGNFPVTAGPIQSTLNGAQNAFFARIYTGALSGNNTVASYATYFGGNGTDSGTSITVDPSLNTYFAGQTNSSNLQVQGALQDCLDTPVNPAVGTPCPTITSPIPTDAFAVQLLTTSDLCITNCVPVVYSPASAVIGAGNPISVTFTILNQGPDLATNITVSGLVSAGAVFSSGNPATAGSGTCSAASGLNVVCTIPALQAGSTSQVAFSVTPSTAGTYSVTAKVNDSNSTNASVTAQASFVATSYSINVSPSSQTVAAGNTAPYTVQVDPAVTFGNNVSLSCGSAPTGASCSFNPSTLAFNGPGALSSNLSLTTTARPVTTISSLRRRSPFYALWLMLPGIALAGAGKRRRSRWLVGIALFTVLGLILALPACSKAKQQPVVSGTPAGTYPISVTATSGTYTQTYVITLTVD
jgi:hypothetical protein